MRRVKTRLKAVMNISFLFLLVNFIKISNVWGVYASGKIHETFDYLTRSNTKKIIDTAAT